jgi:hypothetical protein
MRATLVLLAVLASGLARADHAVVVGVQKYPNLPTAGTLEGCVNDAKAMAAALQALGFKVKLLTNQDATQKNVMAAIADAAARVDSTERFVFYFAGHGRDLPHFSLMPYDATEVGSDITPEALDAAVRAVKARSRSVILDACFSGGFTKGITLRPRYYLAPGTKSSGPRRKASAPESNSHLSPSGEVCYFAASMATEMALEGVFGGEAHGLFTHALLKHLGDLRQRWGTLSQAVKQDITLQLANQGVSQNPTLSQAYSNVALFGGKDETAAVGPPPKSVLDVFSADAVDPKLLTFSPEPDKAEFQAGENLRLKVKVGKPGFLVILGKLGDKYYCFHPGQTKASFKADDCKVEPGPLEFPAGSSDPPLYFDEPGNDFVKAFLLDTKEAAQRLLDAVKRYQDGMSVSDMQKENPSVTPVATAGLAYTVGDSLIGGVPLKNGGALFKRLRKGEDRLARHVWDQLPKEVRDQLRAYGPEETLPSTMVGALLAGLNRAIQNKPIYDETAFKGVTLGPETKRLLVKRPIQGADLLKLNRLLLEDAFPEVGRS